MFDLAEQNTWGSPGQLLFEQGLAATSLTLERCADSLIQPALRLHPQGSAYHGSWVKHQYSNPGITEFVHTSAKHSMVHYTLTEQEGR